MVKGPEAGSNLDLDTNSNASNNPSRLIDNGRESGYASADADVKLNRVQLNEASKLEALLGLDKTGLLKKPKPKRPIKPDYYDFDGDEVPYSPPDEEAYLGRAGIADRQLRPPTSKLLVSMMNYNPARPREALWETYNRREQAVREVVIHPVKDLEYYKLRNCITCKQREKELKAEKEVDQFAPHLQEFLVDDLVDGLTRLVGKVRCFHQEHMCVDSFMNMYLNNHFGNVHYANYDLKTTQEELRRFSKLINCHAETMKCLEMFCTRDQLDGFWRNSGLSSIYEPSRNEISSLLKKKLFESAAQTIVSPAAALDTKDAGRTDLGAVIAPLDPHCSDSDDSSSTADEEEDVDDDNASKSGGDDCS